MIPEHNDDSDLPILDGDLILGAPLGQGGGGSVFEATQRSLGRQVAVKRLHKLRRSDAEQRFREEASTMGRVAHPNIVPVLMHGRLVGEPVLVMERIDGLDLAEVVESLSQSPSPRCARNLREALHTDTLPWSDRTPWWKVASALVAQVARALDHAHRCGILHRDVKPSNVLVSRRGAALLTDFGIAQAIDADDSHPGAPTTSGTFAYCSPEELEGLGMTQASDLYSLGVLARELVTLKCAYTDRTSSVAARIRSISEGRLSPLSRKVPNDLRAVLERATASAPKNRYASAADFARDLENVSMGRAVLARPESRPRRVRRWVRQRSRGATAVATFLVLLCAAPAAIQYSQLAAAERVQESAAAARGHLRLALDGIGNVLMGAANDSLHGQPMLDLKRAELLRTGSDLGRDLAATIELTSAQDSEAKELRLLALKSHQLRISGLRGLVGTERRLGAWDRARAHLAELKEVFAAGPFAADPVEIARNLILECGLALSTGDLALTEALAKRVLESLASFPPNEDLVAKMRSNAWCARIEIAIDRRDSAAAISYGELGVEANRAWLRSADDKKTARCELVRILGNYAAALIQAKRIGQAETVTREALSLLEVVKSTPQTRSFAAIHWNNLGVIERWQQRFPAAAEAELRAVTIQEELLATSPRTVGLQFQTGRSHFRYALSLGRQGKDATKAQRHLQRARSLLGELCRRPNATWAQHCCLTNVMAEFGRIAWSRGAFRDAHEAFDATIRSSEAAEAIAPDHPELRTVRRDAWLRRTNLALSLKIGDGPAQARSFAAEFPGEPEVACHVTSMFCNLAKETLQGDDAGRVELAGDYRSEALDHLKKAVDAGALDHHTITTHRAWKPLHGHPRFDALVQRTK